MRTQTSAAIFRAVATILVCLAATPIRAEDKVRPSDPSAEELTFSPLPIEVLQNATGVTETVVIDMLKLGRKFGRPWVAFVAADSYLRQHIRASPEVFLLTAQNAFLAGDLRAAARHYENAVKRMKPGPERDDAAAELLLILIDFLGETDDAYRFMTEQGASMRGSARGKKFDVWYLDKARSLKDYEGMAKRLAMVMSDKDLPVELERMICWHHLDWLCAEMGTAKEAQIKALPIFDPLSSLVRDDAGRAKRVAFIASVLTFEARARIIDPALRKVLFGKVVDAAKEYADVAPTAATVMDIFAVFGGGWRTFDFKPLAMDTEQKGEVLVYVFPKLSGSERQTLLAWQMNGRRMVEVMTPGSVWNRLAMAMPEWFRERTVTATLPFDTVAGTREDFRKCSSAFTCVTSPKIAVMNAVGGGGTLPETIDRFVTNETWGLEFGDLYRLVSGDLVRVWAQFNDIDTNSLARLRSDAELHLFLNHAAKTPIALFDSDGTLTAFLATWQSVTAVGHDPSDIIPVLQSFYWLPTKDRNMLFGHVRAEFNRWAHEGRRMGNRTVVDKWNALQQAFNNAADMQEPRLDSAPNEVCRKTAEVLIAARNGSNEEVVARGKELYAAVKNYRQDRTPFGGALVLFLAGMNGPKLEPFDLQLKIVSDQLASCKTDADVESFGSTMNAMMASRRWGWGNVPGQDRERAMKVNAELAKALVRLMDQGTFSRQLFDLMRGTAHGNGWSDTSPSDAAMERAIVDRGRGTNAVLKANVRPWELMHIVRKEYQSLNARYPYDRYFDDMVAADIKATRMLDPQYWDYAQDTEKKVSDAAAEVMQGFTRLPLGYGGGPTMDRGVFHLWQARCLDAKPPARDAMLKAVESTYGQTRFDPVAMGAGYFERQASLATRAKWQEFVQRLKTYLDRAAVVPYRVPPPSMVALADLKSMDSLTSDGADQLACVFSATAPEVWAKDKQFDRLVMAMETSLLAQKKDATLASLVPHFWKVARDTGSADLEKTLVYRAKALQDGNAQQLAAAYCLASQEIMGRRMTDSNRQIMQGVRARALASLLRSPPMDKTDKRYPVIAAQLAFMMDRLDEAWEGVQSNPRLLVEMCRGIDPDFCCWVIRKYTQTKMFQEAEDLGRALIPWVDEGVLDYDPETRGRLYLAYSDLSVAKKAYPEARTQFQRVANMDALKGTIAQRMAELRLAEVDRLTKNYDKGIEWLEKLAKRPDRFTRVEANYQLALIKYDQAQPKTPGASTDSALLKEALQYVEIVFLTNPGHAEANILWGKCRNGLKQYHDAKDLTYCMSSCALQQPGNLPGRTQPVADGSEGLDSCEVWIVEKSGIAPAVKSNDDPTQGELRAKVEGKEIPFPLKHTAVNARVSAFIASVDVTQQYENPYDTKIEAVYVFPLPESSAVTDFVMTIGDRHIRGMVRERKEAEKLYAQAKAQGYRAALLTQERPNIFTQKVANIDPGKRIDVKITYFNPLPYHDGEYEFVFPMVVGPRFNPSGSTDGVGAVARGKTGVSGQSTEVEYLKPGERNGHDISLSVDIDAGMKIEKVHSATHAIRTQKESDSRAVVQLSPNDAIPNKDFVLRYKVAGKSMKTAMLVHRTEKENTFALVLQPPEDTQTVDRMPREMVFVLDCSGSMSGAPIAKSKKAVERCLRNLKENDTFQIIEFSISASQFGNAPVPATPENIEKGLAYLGGLNGEGGTMMITGVKAALEFPHDEERLRIVTFLTDGYIGNEAEILKAAKERLGASRIFSFGIGTSVNRYLIEGLASFGKGAVAYVGLDESAGEKVDLFFERVARPALTDIRIDWDGMKVSDVYPKEIPDVFVGRPVMITGRFQGKGRQTIKVAGRSGTARTSYDVKVDLGDKAIEHPAITSLWARWKIRDLSEQAILSEGKDLKDQIIATSIAYNLLSRHTAFLAADGTESTGGGQAKTVNVPVPVPEGVKYKTTVQE